jgi:hypothetical protein
MTSSSILQFTTISNTSSILWLSAIFANFFKIEDEVKGEQGLAALALGKFEEAHENEADCPLEVASGLGWDPRVEVEAV